MLRRMAVTTTLVLAVTTGPVAGQTSTSGTAEGSASATSTTDRTEPLRRVKLSGPRFGFTTFTGETADLRNMADLEPIMSQFGWQFETQIVSTTGGNQALMEWLVLLGGLEQDERSLSLAWLAGYRMANGLEFGVGPNFNANLKENMTNTSMVVAAGATVPFGDLYVPFNLAVALSDGGPRITALLGWIVG